MDPGAFLPRLPSAFSLSCECLSGCLVAHGAGDGLTLSSETILCRDDLDCHIRVFGFAGKDSDFPRNRQTISHFSAHVPTIYHHIEPSRSPGGPGDRSRLEGVAECLFVCARAVRARRARCARNSRAFRARVVCCASEVRRPPWALVVR